MCIGGKGAPTTPLMNSTKSWLDNGSGWQKLHEYSEHLILAMKVLLSGDAAETGSSNGLQETINATGNLRRFFKDSPGFPVMVDQALNQVPGLDQNWTWKTTGAGGEDAILLIGKKSDTRSAAESLAKSGWVELDRPFARLPVTIDELSETGTA